MQRPRALAIEERGELAEPFALRAVFAGGPYVLLENPGAASEVGRWALLAGDPHLVFRARRGAVEVGPPGALERVDGGPFEVLAGLLARFGAPVQRPSEELPPYLAGAVGYLGYELLYALEPTVPDLGEDDLPAPDALLLFCSSTLAVDRKTGRGFLIAQAFGDTQGEAERLAAEGLASLRRRVDATRAAPLLERRFVSQRPTGRLREEDVRAAGFRPRTPREDYVALVRRAKESIEAGELSEVCTAQRFDRPWRGDTARLYEVLRAVNPAPFSAYLSLPGLEIASSSPERFLRLDRDGLVETRPIKGTRPRGRTPERDEALRQDLATAPKDRAENVMIVDLCRNDLGRVCEIGTVRVPSLLAVEAHPFTFQLVSTVQGRLRAGLGPVDLLRAAFPGGSMTGAPKVQAMKLIDALEPVKRGVFSGCIGYLDADGAMDLSIVIRTFVARGGRLHFHVGGAVVSDSEPDEEYQETLDKAHALIHAFAIADALEPTS